MIRRIDPPAAVVSAIVAVLGLLGVMDEWGMTADDVATVTGIAMAIAATVRSVLDRKG